MSSTLILGPFEVGGPLGVGANGVVHRALHRQTDTPAAVKMLAASYATPKARAAFRHEVELMAGLDHHGVVPVFDHGVVPEHTSSEGGPRPGAPYMVMALAEQGALADHAGLSWPAVAALLHRVLGGLAHAHGRGCVHCDLKPGNILLAGSRDDARPLLADFGVAHAFRGEVRSEMVGTPAYMAPEQILEPRDIGPWSDLYAIGCLAFEMVCGMLPFAGTTPLSYAVAHASGQRRPSVPTLDGVPEEMGIWLDGLLTRDWRTRYRTAAAAAAALARFAPVDASIILPHGGPASGFAPTVDEQAATEVSAAFGEAIVHAESSDSTGPILPVNPLDVPADWRRGTRARPPWLLGAGRALFGLRTPPFVGRETERDRIWAALGDTWQRRTPRAVILSGAAGTGKSRLARWMTERADELGVGFAVELCHGPTPTPGDGLAGALQRIVQPTGTRDAERVRRMRGGDVGDVDGADALVVRLCDDTGSGPAIAPKRRYTVASDLMRSLAGERAVLVMVDDAQWGPDSLAFARWLLDRPYPALIVITVRSDVNPGAAGPALDALRSDPRVEDIALAPLDRAQHVAFVDRLLPLAPDTAAQVADCSVGHPLMAVQLIGSWIEQDLLRTGAHGFEIAGSIGAAPASLSALWQTRIASLAPGEDDRQAIAIGATLGERVDGRAWRSACEISGLSPSPDLLDRMVRSGLARSSREGWRFAHGLLRDAVSNLVHPGRVRSAHVACATALGRLNPDTSPRAMRRIAEHWQAADEPAAALAPLRSAAGLLLDRMHRDQVRPLLDRHDALLDELGAAADDPRRARSGTLRAYLAFADADLEQTEADFAATRPLVERHGLESERGRLLRLRGMMLRLRGNLEAAERLFRAASVQCAAIGLMAESGKALLGLVNIYHRLGRPGAMEAIAEAETCFETAGDSFWLNTVRVERSRMCRETGALDEAADLLATVIAVARRTGDESNESRGLHTRAIVRRMQRRVDDARADLAAARTMYARTNNINGLILGGELAMLALLDGDFEGACSHARATLDGIADTMWSSAYPSGDVLLAAAHVGAGRPAEADTHLDAFEQRVREPPRSRGLADATQLAFDTLVSLGDRARAARVAPLAAILWERAGDPARAAAVRPQPSSD